MKFIGAVVFLLLAQLSLAQAIGDGETVIVSPADGSQFRVSAQTLPSAPPLAFHPATLSVEARKQSLRDAMELKLYGYKLKLQWQSDPEVLELQAKQKRAYFEALVQQGFTDDEALKLLQGRVFSADLY